MLDKNEKPLMVTQRPLMENGSGVDMPIIFQKDGAVIKLVSATLSGIRASRMKVLDQAPLWL
jgi:hypothetical protein